MIVWLSSIPRSGNTFLRMLLHYYTKDRIVTYSLMNDPIFFKKGVADIIGHRRMPSKSLKALRMAEHVYFIKTHDSLMPTSESDKSVMIVRDPHDALVSFAHYRVHRGNASDVKREIERLVKVSDWHKHCERSLEFADVVIRYEDLIVDTYGEVERLVSILQLPLELERIEVPSFEELHKKYPQFFRKGVVGSSKTLLTPRLEDILFSRMGDVMQRLGYEKWTYQ